MRFDLTSGTLSAAKDAAYLKVDREAEAARLLYITNGSGQSQEYRLTEEQARAYKGTSYATPFDSAKQALYPMVYAEMQAANDAEPITYPMTTQGEINTLAVTITDQIIAEADAWKTAASAIKRLRRGAKRKIAIATTIAQVYAATQITWPSP